MENKKGIKVKAKQTSLVDNIVGFFKRDKPNQEEIAQNNDVKSDISPRSTTPRKKIFSKTPQKAGKINFHNQRNVNSNQIDNLNNKSMDAAYEISFNNDLKHQNINNISPRKTTTNILHPLGDTQFNKLILDNSRPGNGYNPSNNNYHSHLPQKTFLTQQNSNLSIRQRNTINQHPTNIRSNNLKSQNSRNLQKQIENHVKLNQQLSRENAQLKRQNQQYRKQILKLKQIVKSYEVSNKVQITHLDNPKSPFDKALQKKVNNNQKISIKKQLTNGKQKIKTSPLHNETISMKQSIPILPDISYEYSNSRSPPKMQQMSLMSLNLKNISHQSSFFSQQPSFDNSQNLILRGMQKDKNNKNNNSFNDNIKSANNNPIKNNNVEQSQIYKANDQKKQIMSPFLQKTYYDKTMKPQQVRKKQRVQQINNRQRRQDKIQQITFSKTIGYLKGDQPSQAIVHQPSQNRSKNPFQQIATQSNKFFFNQQQSYLNEKSVGASPSSKNFKVFEGKPTKSKEWMSFQQNQSSIQHSQNTGNNQSRVNPFQVSRMNPFEGNNRAKDYTQKQTNKNVNQNRLKSPNQSSFKKDNSKLLIQGSKTYKFQDFQINEDQSAVDFF